jgi:hypothetical protein
VIDLEHALTDLAEHLDHPAGDHLAAEVRRRLSTPTPIAERRPNRGRALLVAAAVFVVIATVVTAIPPTREAIADWLGIGGVEIRRTNQPLPTNGSNPVPGQPGAPPVKDAPARLAEARKRVQFEIRTPQDPSTGALFDAEVDRGVPGGLVALRYERFTLIEVASANEMPPLRKFAGSGTTVEFLTVGGLPGAWITGGEHAIGYLNRANDLVFDTVRRSGPVLLWEREGVTYRIEGIDTLTDAQRIAESIPT